MAHRFRKLALLAATSLGVGAGAPVYAQSADRSSVDDTNDIIVTARRREERLQDVPISVTVFSQQQISDRNITSATDLSTYTPSLASNNRFASDFASYSIRGFTQELRTTASVGIYFADVVAQRAGQTSVTSGDGAGPGAFFDLANVQVLKGPQGTLFGRNTTGGAVMLTPQKPTDRLEGYVEGSVGNYDMWRLQAVLNLPLSDQIRLRLGVDRSKRDGWQHNLSGIGPDRAGAQNYVAARASLVLDLGSVENYTIGSYSDSHGTPDIEQMFACAPAPGTPGAIFNPADPRQIVQATINRACIAQLAAKHYGFFDVASQIANPSSKIRSWQVINTTTWTASDHLTVKNIFAYGELWTRLRSALFGTDFHVPANAPLVGGTPYIFSNVNPLGGGRLTDQRNVVEELQLQGNTDSNKLVWQVGFYYEHSTPKSFVGTLGDTNIYCPNNGDQTADPARIRCQDPLSQYLFGGFAPIANLTSTRLNQAFENIAAYAQATYNFTPQIAVTGGFRHTWDKSESEVEQFSWRGFPKTTVGPPTLINCIKIGASLANNCFQSFRKNSSAPTWLIDLEYRPNPDLLLYAKYSRGYRQGAAVPISADGFETYDPEKVDAYEIGAKASFHGPIRGYFNVAAFYNSLKDQQIQIGFYSTVVNSTTGIVNAGKSRIAGVEVESRLIPLEGLSFDVGYTYLDTKVIDITIPALPPGSLYTMATASVNEGDPLALSPKHKVSLTGTYTLPLDESVGQVSLGATYVYTSSQLTATSSPFGTLPGYDVVNLNLSWNKIGGSPIDAAFFVTNLFDKHYTTYVSGLYTSVGAEFRNVGLPRMLGARVRVSFGS